MLIKTQAAIKESAVTDYALYQRRRDFLKIAGVALTGTVLPSIAPAGLQLPGYQPDPDSAPKTS